jgi:hypothetical protein
MTGGGGEWTTASNSTRQSKETSCHTDSIWGTATAINRASPIQLDLPLLRHFLDESGLSSSSRLKDRVCSIHRAGTSCGSIGGAQLLPTAATIAATPLAESWQVIAPDGAGG